MKGISGSTLKYIAVITMFIDHIGAAVVERVIVQMNGGGLQIQNLPEIMTLTPHVQALLILDWTFRFIGRLSFPIFCFLLVEGFLHTKDAWKYAVRLAVFAVISEIPFNLAFAGRIFYKGHQNVFWTLLIALLVMIVFSYIKKTNWHTFVKGFLYIISMAAGMAGAQMLETDYGAFGVFGILTLYILHENKSLQLLAGSLVFVKEITAPLAFIPLSFYNGERGKGGKYVFYAFYPLHLFLLYLIAYLTGLAPFAVK